MGDVYEAIVVGTTDDGVVEVLEVTYHEPTEEELRHSLIAFYIFLFTVIFAQSALVHWRKAHRRSYELVTLIGLWLVPPIFSIFGQFWRFLFIWSFFSGVTGYFLYRCIFEPSMEKSLPKLVYRWFFVVFRTSVAIGAVGYVLLLMNIFLFAGMEPLGIDTTGISILALWYGLYFGILTRDCAEVASERIANRLGGARRMAVSVRDCGICGGELKDAMRLGGVADAANGGAPVTALPDDGDASVQLSCKHIVHADCAKGWLIVGKKDTCPVCNERVDLRALYANKPWETKNLQWTQMLDFFRYMVVWQPAVLMGLHFIFHWTGLDDESGAEGGDTAAALNATAAALNATAAAAGLNATDMAAGAALGGR